MIIVDNPSFRHSPLCKGDTLTKGTERGGVKIGNPDLVRLKVLYTDRVWTNRYVITTVWSVAFSCQ